MRTFPLLVLLHYKLKIQECQFQQGVVSGKGAAARWSSQDFDISKVRL